MRYTKERETQLSRRSSIQIRIYGNLRVDRYSLIWRIRNETTGNISNRKLHIIAIPTKEISGV